MRSISPACVISIPHILCMWKRSLKVRSFHLRFLRKNSTLLSIYTSYFGNKLLRIWDFVLINVHKTHLSHYLLLNSKNIYLRLKWHALATLSFQSLGPGVYHLDTCPILVFVNCFKKREEFITLVVYFYHLWWSNIIILQIKPRWLWNQDPMSTDKWSSMRGLFKYRKGTYGYLGILIIYLVVYYPFAFTPCTDLNRWSR